MSQAPMKNETYSAEEQLAILLNMKVASLGFYAMAQLTNCHAFLEFSGLMNEFIKICTRESMTGRDFTTSAHGGQPLNVLPPELEYIHTKLECIFGRGIVNALTLNQSDAVPPSLQDP